MNDESHLDGWMDGEREMRESERGRLRTEKRIINMNIKMLLDIFCFGIFISANKDIYFLICVKMKFS